MLNQTEEKFSHGDIFNLFNESDLTKSVVKGMSGYNDSILFFRFFRAGLVGQSLYDESFVKMEKLDRIKLESIGCLCELYIFYLRSIYDHLLKFLAREIKTDLPRSFNKFIKRVELGNFPNISDDFKKMLKENKFSFEELRNLRDSIKEKPSAILPYINEKGEIFIKVKIFGRDKREIKTIDEELSIFVYSRAISIWYLMLLIHKELNSKEVEKVY